MLSQQYVLLKEYLSLSHVKTCSIQLVTLPFSIISTILHRNDQNIIEDTLRGEQKEHNTRKKTIHSQDGIMYTPKKYSLRH